MDLRQYLNTLSPTSQRDFARACQTSLNYLRKGLSTGQKFKMELCIRIEKNSEGVVCCEEIRPDLIDEWEHYRNRECPCNKQAA